jgi:predicted dithiol-disulfide oxidoreductase (DUF899 family)
MYGPDWDEGCPSCSSVADRFDDSAYARGLDPLWNMWQWLDRAPEARAEGDLSWFQRHDQYAASYR